MPLPSFTTAARTGADALRANPVRALLATLGVVIGAAALVAVLAVGDGVERTARDAVGRRGYDLVQLTPITTDTVDGQFVPRDTIPSFAVADVPALAEALARARGPGERVSLSTLVTHVTTLGRSPRRRLLMVDGIARSAPSAQPDTLLAGRHLTPEETRSGAPVAVISLALARAMGDSSATAAASGTAASGTAATATAGAAASGTAVSDDAASRTAGIDGARNGADTGDAKGDPIERARDAARAAARDTTGAGALARASIGDSLRLGATWVRVVGVLAPPSEDDALGGRFARPLRASVPYAVAASLAGAARGPFGGSGMSVLTVRARRAEEVKPVQAEVQRWLDARDPRWRTRFRVQAGAEDLLKQIEQAMTIFKLLMGAFTSITLIVGGIGIMNVLLASVAERTREIGIRKAVGARRRDILLQFLAESVTITAAGSAIGTALGLGAAYLITWIMRQQSEAPVYAATTATTLAISAGMAVLVGLAFGCYPALRAARLAPIEAIHTE